MLILNCSNTLDKRFDVQSDNMKLFDDNKAIKSILKNTKNEYQLTDIHFKNSLKITNIDRVALTETITNSKDSLIILLHELTNILETSKFLSKTFNNKRIILIGIREPFEINKIESSLHIGISIGFAKACIDNGIYICKEGTVVKYTDT